MNYRVRWTKTVTTTGYVNDGDQDGDAWEGSRKQAIAMALDMRARRHPNYTYKIESAPSPGARKGSP